MFIELRKDGIMKQTINHATDTLLPDQHAAPGELIYASIQGLLPFALAVLLVLFLYR